MSNGNEQETELDLDENVAGALCYIMQWFTGIVFLLIEKKNEFVRFHAMQSIVIFLPLWILNWGLIWIASPFYAAGFGVLYMLSRLILLAILGLWLLMMYKAYQGEKYKLPIAGDIAENQLK